jgi:hypothetical protein
LSGCCSRRRRRATTSSPSHHLLIWKRTNCNRQLIESHVVAHLECSIYFYSLIATMTHTRTICLLFIGLSVMAGLTRTKNSLLLVEQLQLQSESAHQERMVLVEEIIGPISLSEAEKDFAASVLRASCGDSWVASCILILQRYMWIFSYVQGSFFGCTVKLSK